VDCEWLSSRASDHAGEEAMTGAAVTPYWRCLRYGRPRCKSPPARRTTSAETIARALGGHPTSGGWTVRCPAHDDRTPSLSIRHTNDDKVLVHCHAGCDQQRVIAAVRARGLWADGDRLAIRGTRYAPAPSRASRAETTQGAARSHSPHGNPPSRRRARWSRSISPREEPAWGPRTRCAFMPI
jgi:hypothetical protein